MIIKLLVKKVFCFVQKQKVMREGNNLGHKKISRRNCCYLRLYFHFLAAVSLFCLFIWMDKIHSNSVQYYLPMLQREDRRY